MVPARRSYTNGSIAVQAREASFFLGRRTPILSSRVVLSSVSRPGRREGNGPGGAGPRGVLVWRLQEFPTGPTGTSVKEKGI
jgi:hypothetical protein